MTRAQLAALWLWVRLVSPDTHVRDEATAAVLEYPELVPQLTRDMRMHS